MPLTTPIMALVLIGLFPIAERPREGGIGRGVGDSDDVVLVTIVVPKPRHDGLGGCVHLVGATQFLQKVHRVGTLPVPSWFLRVPFCEVIFNGGVGAPA